VPRVETDEPEYPDAVLTIAERVSPYRNTIDRFLVDVSRLLLPMAEKRLAEREKRHRRPNVSLRLLAEGNPPLKLITMPQWRKEYGVITGTTGGWLLEMMERYESTIQHYDANRNKTGEEKALRWRKSKLSFRESGTLGYSAVYGDFDRLMPRVTRLMRDFLSDKRKVLARSCDHCSICGKGLTDGLSRARGIGPECVKYVDVTWFKLKDGAKGDPVFQRDD
jgi:hypothetical protein